MSRMGGDLITKRFTDEQEQKLLEKSRRKEDRQRERELR